MTKDEALALALDVLERASHSLGSFVSDHGWGQEDMNTLDSVIAAEHRIKEALAQPEQEPVAWEQFHEYLVERNFCPRCGKRLASGFVEISIHTCTPPREKT